jgi:hypothetical protein
MEAKNSGSVELREEEEALEKKMWDCKKNFVRKHCDAGFKPR